MLFGPNGQPLVGAPQKAPTRVRPEPQPEAEQRIRETVQAIDSSLDVKWMAAVARYALVCRWPLGDPRWELHQNGQIEWPFDMIGWFCVDMQDPQSLPVSVDSIERLVLERIHACDATRIPHKQRMEQIAEKNIKLAESRRKALGDKAEDVARDLWRAASHNEAVVVERMMKQLAEEGLKEAQNG